MSLGLLIKLCLPTFMLGVLIGASTVWLWLSLATSSPTTSSKATHQAVTPVPTGSVASATTSATPIISATPSVTPTTQPSPTQAKAMPSHSPTPTAAKPAISYPWHRDILTTVFWVGEQASADNHQISNQPSAWNSNWTQHFGGVDDPNHRNGWLPASFTPKENPFYIALPYGDYNDQGLKTNITSIYWYQPISNGQSLLKNRWLEINYGGKTVYGQWEDVGPFADNDVGYVFGSAKPQQKVGLDVSPAINDYLGLGQQAITSWRFIEASQVPDGPWKHIITTSEPDW